MTKWRQRGVAVLCILTTLQGAAGLVALYAWGFGAHVPSELGTALILGPFITGAPVGFLVID